MKLTVCMKTPDAVEYAVKDAVEREFTDVDPTGRYDDPEELEWEKRQREEELTEQLSKWFSYGECVNIEIDTEAGTATVVKPGY